MRTSLRLGLRPGKAHAKPREPRPLKESARHRLKKFLVGGAHLFVAEGRLHIELNAEHGPPWREVLKQLLGAPGLADHHTAAGLRTMGAADQFEAIETIRLGSTGHVIDQFRVGSLLAFDLRELPGHVVELHCSRKKPLVS